MREQKQREREWLASGHRADQQWLTGLSPPWAHSLAIIPLSLTPLLSAPASIPSLLTWILLGPTFMVNRLWNRYVLSFPFILFISPMKTTCPMPSGTPTTVFALCQLLGHCCIFGRSFLYLWHLFFWGWVGHCLPLLSSPFHDFLLILLLTLNFSIHVVDP